MGGILTYYLVGIVFLPLKVIFTEEQRCLFKDKITMSNKNKAKYLFKKGLNLLMIHCFVYFILYNSLHVYLFSDHPK
jgi:hypothetical protein